MIAFKPGDRVRLTRSGWRLLYEKGFNTRLRWYELTPRFTAEVMATYDHTALMILRLEHVGTVFWMSAKHLTAI